METYRNTDLAGWRSGTVTDFDGPSELDSDQLRYSSKSYRSEPLIGKAVHGKGTAAEYAVCLTNQLDHG